MSDKLKAARALLAARDAQLLAYCRLKKAERIYVDAEKEYLKAIDVEGGNYAEPRAMVLNGTVISLKEDWYDEKDGERLEFRRVEVLDRSGPPQFMVQWANAARAEFCDLEEIVSANAEVDPELCEWARNAEVGDSYPTGGGASPAVMTWRIA